MAEVVDDRALRLGVEMFERVGGRFVVERTDDARGVARREVADDLGQIGGVQPREAESETDSWICVGLRSCSGATLSQAISVRGSVSTSARPRLPAAEPAHDAAEPDVGRDDAQRAAGARDLDVVDAHDLAAVDVDDLFVEEILDQIERFVVGRRPPASVTSRKHEVRRRRTRSRRCCRSARGACRGCS